MEYDLHNLPAVHLFWLLPALVGLYAYSFRRRRRALERLATANLVGHLTAGVSVTRQRARAILRLLGCALLVAALVDPRWNAHYEDVPQHGVDVMFCLDISRSMLAEDVTPNRLERAKQYISDIVATLSGDRVGLVSFAGSAALKCPLTVDYGAFRMALDEISPRSSPRGGTLIGDAIRLAVNSFTDQVKNYKSIILITDGEDHESYPLEAARQAHEQLGVRVCAIGIGDPDQGQRIPVEQDGTRVYLQHEGQEVWSKLEGATLEAIAKETKGIYVPAGTHQVDMGQVYEQMISTTEQREYETSRIKQFDVQFQWFAGAALVLLACEALMTDRRRAAAGAAAQRQAA